MKLIITLVTLRIFQEEKYGMLMPHREYISKDNNTIHCMYQFIIPVCKQSSLVTYYSHFSVAFHTSRP